MLCVLGIRSSVLPDAWGDVCDSICLTIWVTHDPSTGVRATTSLGGERAHQRCLFSPLPTVFSRALFSTTLPTLVENECSLMVPTISCARLVYFRSVQHHGSVQLWVLHGGGWGRRKAGDWGRKPGRGRGIAAGLPPFPWVVSPSSSRTVLRVPSTQSIQTHPENTITKTAPRNTAWCCL